MLLSTCDIIESYPRVIKTTLKCVEVFKFTNLKVQTEEIIFERLSSLLELEGCITGILPNNTFISLRKFCQIDDVHYR